MLADFVGRAFRLLSAVRGARIFHPRGVGYEAVVRVPAAVPGLPGVRLLERAGEHAAICRFSRGGGLPEPVPDVLGVAIRILDLYGPGAHQDFLLATGGRGRVTRHLLLFGPRGFFGHALSSLLPYRFGGAVRMVAAESDQARAPSAAGTVAELEDAAVRGGLSFRVMLAPLGGEWSTVAELDVRARLPDDEIDRVAFTPWYTGGGIRPVGPLQRLRRPAYRGSQRGRGLEPHEIP